MFKIYDEPESPKERACFKIHDDPELPNGGACLRHMMMRNLYEWDVQKAGCKRHGTALNSLLHEKILHMYFPNSLRQK